ncbi:MAG: L-lactate permease [Candidatus Methylomirabilales bacterium]
MAGPHLSPLTWLTAALPLAIILILMVQFRWGGARAGPVGAVSAALAAVLVFGAGPGVLGVALWKGVILSLHVLYIIWPALLLYHVVEGSGAIRSIGGGVAALTEDHILQLLILGFAFSSFLQGVAGFGVPVAVVAPLLIGLGFPPVQATAVPLVGHAWAVTMGDLASSFQALVAVTDLPARALGLWTAVFLGIACLLTGFCVAHLHAGFRPIRRCLGAIVLLSVSMTVTQLVLAYLESWILASFCAGMVGLTLGLVLARLSHGGRPTVMGLLPSWPPPWGRRTPHREVAAEFKKGKMGFHLAFSAYYGLVVIVTAATLIPPLHRILNALRPTFYFPQTVTASGWVTEASHYALSLFGHPGAYLLYTAAFAWGMYRVTGHWETGEWRVVVRRTVEEGIPTSIGILFMVVMAMVMSYSGMTFLLARGTIAVAGGAYPVLSPFVGLLGCFMTGSNTNSNVLFGALQRDIALLLGKNPAVMAALQTTGGALGSMVAPAKVLVACATAGLQGKEGEVMGVTMRYCLPLTLLIGILGWVILSL